MTYPSQPMDPGSLARAAGSEEPVPTYRRSPGPATVHRHDGGGSTHSERSASIGSTRVACRAGSAQAARLMASSMSATDA